MSRLCFFLDTYREADGLSHAVVSTSNAEEILSPAERSGAFSAVEAQAPLIHHEYLRLLCAEVRLGLDTQGMRVPTTNGVLNEWCRRHRI